MKRARKWLAFVLVMVMMLTLTACGGSQRENGMNRENNDNQGVQEKEPFDAEKVLSQLDVTEYRTTAEGHTFTGIMDGERQLVYHVKNNSNFHVKLTFKITTYNTAKEVVEILHQNISVVESGTEAILKFTKLEEYESCVYEIKAEEVDVEESITSKLSHEIAKTQEKILLTLTNNNEKYVYVYAYLLCYQGGEMVYCHNFSQSILLRTDLSSGASKTLEWNSRYGFNNQYDRYQPVIWGKSV